MTASPPPVWDMALRGIYLLPGRFSTPVLICRMRSIELTVYELLMF